MSENIPIKIPASPEFIKSVVVCISNSICDDIKEDIYSHHLQTQNSTPFRIWDLLNTKLCETFNSPNCMATPTKRGLWELVVVYDKHSNHLYTFMREKRFRELQKTIYKRKKAHYVDALVGVLNADLLSSERQMSFFPTNFQFEDQEDLPVIVEKILSNLKIDCDLVQHHVLVLFESSHFELTSIRAVMIDSQLNIVCEDNWSSYISVNESYIVDKIASPESPQNNPTRSLKLKSKATERKNLANLRLTNEKSHNA